MSTLTRIQSFLGARGSVSAAKLSLKEYSAGWESVFGLNDKNIVSVTPLTALSSPGVYAVVDRLTSGLAALPFRVHEKSGKSRIVADDHDQSILLSKAPHTLYSSYTFLRTLYANYYLHGDGFAKIYRHHYTSRPYMYELWKPYSTQVYEDTNQNTGHKFLYFKNLETGEIVLDEDMIHISDLSLNGKRGLSKISLHKENIGSGLSATKMAKKIYEQGSFLGGWLEYAQSFNVEQLEKYRTSFSDNYSGMQQAGKIAALDGGSKFHPLTYTLPLSDAQYAEQKSIQLEEAAVIFNYPLALLKGDQSGKASIEQLMIFLVQSCLAPFVKMVEQEFDRKIFRTSNKKYYTKIDLKGLLRGDIKTRTEYYKARFETASMNPNEIRALEDENPRPGGDEYFVPVNNLLPASKLDEYFSALIDSKLKKNEK